MLRDHVGLDDLRKSRKRQGRRGQRFLEHRPIRHHPTRTTRRTWGIRISTRLAAVRLTTLSRTLAQVALAPSRPSSPARIRSWEHAEQRGRHPDAEARGEQPGGRSSRSPMAITTSGQPTAWPTTPTRPTPAPAPTPGADVGAVEKAIAEGPGAAPSTPAPPVTHARSPERKSSARAAKRCRKKKRSVASRRGFRFAYPSHPPRWAAEHNAFRLPLAARLGAVVGGLTTTPPGGAASTQRLQRTHSSRFSR